MKKLASDNKGMALAYTILMMLVVFAICTAILTIMFAQVSYTDKYSKDAACQNAYLQIGEIFVSVNGNEARFKEALEEKYTKTDENSVTVDEFKFTLNLSQANTLKVNKDGATCLTVTVDSGTVTCWQDGRG